MSVAALSEADKIYKKSFHRRNDSGELDVFEAARYFSGGNEIIGRRNQSPQHSRSRMKRRARVGGGKGGAALAISGVPALLIPSPCILPQVLALELPLLMQILPQRPTRISEAIQITGKWCLGREENQRVGLAGREIQIQHWMRLMPVRRVIQALIYSSCRTMTWVATQVAYPYMRPPTWTASREEHPFPMAPYPYNNSFLHFFLCMYSWECLLVFHFRFLFFNLQLLLEVCLWSAGALEVHHWNCLIRLRDDLETFH
ncbi:unnamed protein product, partial [Vitis vinifera]